MTRITAALLFLTLTACSAKTDGDNPPAVDDFRGQWVVVNYWARWCKPCIEEIPELNALNAQHAEVTVLGVNYDGAQGEELAEQVADLNVQFATLPQDPAAQLGISRPVVLPTTLIIGPDGALRQSLKGPQTRETLLEAMGLATTAQE